MSTKLLLHIFIVCGIWSQGIIGTFAEEDIKKSNDLLLRQKRVVSHVPGENSLVQVNKVPYIVIIRNPTKIHCIGHILSHHVVITPALCVAYGTNNYIVVSSTARTNRGILHGVTDIRMQTDVYARREADGVALLTVNPPFVYSKHCQPISLHSEPLLPGTIGQVSGWGVSGECAERGTDLAKCLRSIEVPIISHQECVNRYTPHIKILHRDICTYHPQRHCGHNDFGAGLVINGHLAGIFLWSGLNGTTNPHYPEVFAILQDSQYHQWIISNVQSIELHFQNLHHH